MLWRLTGGKALPALVIEQIAGKTDGVPLFVEELTRMLLESGQLQQTGQGFELTASFDQLAIPLTLQDSLMARLDRLGPGKEIAQWAAVLGREFSHELLAAAVPFAEAALQQGLEALLEAGLLHQRGLAPQARYIFKHALIRDIAYQSLLKRQRQQLHQRIAEVLEARFGAITRTQPELLAWHYERAQQSEPSIGYWHRAGQLALERSAYQEAIRHLQHALELLATLPDTPARARRELELQITLGPALGAARGSAAVELQQAYSRALDLSSQLGEQSQRFSVLFGLWRFHVMRSQALHARALAEQCLELAQQNNDSGLLLGAHWALGVSQFMLGELAQAHEQFRQGAALYDARVHHVLTFRYGFDPGIYGLLYDSLTLWLLGYPQQSLAQNEAAMTAARLKPHHYNLALAHYFTARLHQFRREPDAALIQAEAALALCQEHDIAYFGASSMIVQGWAFAMQHQYQQGIALMQQGWTAIRAMQGKVWGAFLFACQTEGHLANGRFEPAWNTLTDVFRFRQDTEDCCWDGELQRLKGQLLLVRPDGSESDAENCLQQALDITRRQQARSLELRAATDLARLWLQQGKRDQAQALLAPVYAWFSEGFDSVDLREAKALLELPGSLPEPRK
jgi:predicted ATPase